MNKLIFALALYLLSNNMVFSQLSGDGSNGFPLTGTVVPPGITLNPEDFSVDPIWFYQITILSGATLKIGEGLTVSTRSGGFMTINNSGTLVIEAGAAFSPRTFTNNGAFIMESNETETGSASVIFQSAPSGSGTYETQLYLIGDASEPYPWHYISSPVSTPAGIPANIFTSNGEELYQYIESRVTSSDNMAGWVASDGYNYVDPDNPGPTFDHLLVGKGYDFYSETSAQYIISGPLNYQQVDIPLTCGTGFLDYQGYNLIGNPFPSFINWDIIYVDLPLEVGDAIYVTNYDQISTYVGSVGQGDASNYIPPMQGFFVKVITEGSSPSITIPIGARAHDPFSQIRYKGTSKNYESPDSIPLLRLNLENQNDSTDLVVRFDNQATTKVDKRFDAYKFAKTSGRISTWTRTEDIDYAINGLPFPETSVDIPVGIFTSSAGIYKLSASELKNLDNYNVTLKDLSTNTTVDLIKGKIMLFDAPKGLTEDRFVLTIANLTTVVPEIEIPDKKFSIYSAAGNINILSLTDEFNSIAGSVTIYDLTGRKILHESNIEWHGKGELKQIMLNSEEQGLFIVEIKAGQRRYVEKVNLRK